MGATTDFDRARLYLDDILGHLVLADQVLYPVALRLTRRALSESERADLEGIINAREHLLEAHRQLLVFHPDALLDEKGCVAGPKPRWVSLAATRENKVNGR
jgi:hypothetical protein